MMKKCYIICDVSIMFDNRYIKWKRVKTLSAIRQSVITGSKRISIQSGIIKHLG